MARNLERGSEEECSKEILKGVLKKNYSKEILRVVLRKNYSNQPQIEILVDV